MKPHQSKKHGQNKNEKGGKRRAIKKYIEKGGKGNKTLSQKKQKGGGIFFDKKSIKKKEPKIKLLEHKLLAFTLSYLMLAPW
jgi:hypothetical protein